MSVVDVTPAVSAVGAPADAAAATEEEGEEEEEEEEEETSCGAMVGAWDAAAVAGRVEAAEGTTNRGEELPALGVADAEKEFE